MSRPTINKTDEEKAAAQSKKQAKYVARKKAEGGKRLPLLLDSPAVKDLEFLVESGYADNYRAVVHKMLKEVAEEVRRSEPDNK
jgi:hypothetical protein